MKINIGVDAVSAAIEILNNTTASARGLQEALMQIKSPDLNLSIMDLSKVAASAASARPELLGLSQEFDTLVWHGNQMKALGETVFGPFMTQAQQAKVKVSELTQEEYKQYLQLQEMKRVMAEALKTPPAAAGLLDTLRTIRSAIISATVVFGTMAAAAIGAFKAMERGAEVEQTKISFDRLILSVGGTTQILQQLRDASAGTISDTNLMSSTIQGLAGTTGEFQREMLKNAPILVEIARAAAALNPTLVNTEEAYNRLTEAAKKGERRLLDELGIRIQAKDAYKAYAEAIGVSVDSLTAEQKQTAFLNEEIRVGKILIDQNGEAVKNATDAYEKFKTSLKNAGDQTAELASRQGGLLDILQKVPDYLNKSATTYNLLADAENRGLINQERYMDSLDKLIGGPEPDQVKLIEKLTKAIADYDKKMHDASQTTDEFDRHVDDNNARLRAADDLLDQATRRTQTHTQAIIETTNAYAGKSLLELQEIQLTQQIQDEQDKLSGAQDAAGESALEAAIKVEQYKDQLMKLKEKSPEFIKAQEDMKNAVAGFNMVLSMGLSGQATKNTEDYNKALADYAEKVQKAKGNEFLKNIKLTGDGMQDLITIQKALNDQIGYYTGHQGELIPQTKEAAEAQADLADATWDYDTKQMSLNLALSKFNEAQGKLAGYEAALTEAHKDGSAYTDKENGKLLDLQQTLQSTAISYRNAQGGAKDLGEKIGELNTTVEKGAPRFADYTSAIRGLKGTSAEVAAEMEAIRQQFIETNKQLVFSSIQQAMQIFGKDKTPEGATALIDIAEKMGLMDQKSADLARATLDLTKAYADGTLPLGSYKNSLDHLTGSFLDDQGLITAEDKAKEKQQKLHEVWTEYKNKHIPEFVEATGKAAAGLHPAGKGKDKTSLSGAAEGAQTSLDEFGKFLLQEAGEGGGLYSYRVGTQGLANEIGLVSNNAKLAISNVSALYWYIMHPPTVPGLIPPVGPDERGRPHASGGNVIGGQTIVVGEHGVEEYRPYANGYIVPNNAMGSNIGTLVLNVGGTSDPSQTARMVIYELERRGILSSSGRLR